MIAHIAKLTNTVVATENEEEPNPESFIAILYYKLVIDLLFNMSYIQIINKYSWTNEPTIAKVIHYRVFKMRRVVTMMDAGYCRSYSTLMPPLMAEIPGRSVYK